MATNPYFLNSYPWRGILALLLGLALIIWPGFAAHYMITIIGAMLLVIGVILATAYYSSRKDHDVPSHGFPIGAAIYLIAGILLVAMPGTLASIFIVVLGLLLILLSLDQVYMLAVASRRGAKVHPARYVAPVLILVTGIILALNPGGTMEVMIRVFGIAAVIYGIVDLSDQYSLRR